MMRCDPCDCDVCALCVASVPAQEAKVKRVKAAARAAQLAATNAGMESAERLDNMSIGQTTVAPGPPPPPTGGLPSPQPHMTSALPPPPCYGMVAAPSYDGRAAAEEPSLPSYGAMAASSSEACSNGHGAKAPALPSYDAMAGSSPAAAPSYQNMAAISTSFPGGQQQTPAYSGFVQERNGHNPPPPASCSPERETPAPTASAANGAESPFAFDSVVRVLGVEDPEVQGKLLTVIGFEADGGGGTVVLQRRGRVVSVPASKVYKLMD